ncbi:MAG TPA: RDD family protein [Candidatus Bathyarchaeia archaeon]|nr:RDD family protein [Candidatus Bathyarchaeia archaeon]
MVYCWKCGSEVRDDADFCSKCGASIRGTMGVQARTGFELLGNDKSVQNHWARRLIALVIDWVIVAVVLTVIAALAALPFLFSLSTRTVSTFPGWWGAWWGVWWAGIGGVILFLYFFLAEGLYARTIGKEIMGLRIARIDGKPMDFRSSLIRNISKIYWLLLLVDVLVGLGTHGEMSQKWTDRYVGTKVEEKTHMTIIS